VVRGGAERPPSPSWVRRSFKVRAITVGVALLGVAIVGVVLSSVTVHRDAPPSSAGRARGTRPIATARGVQQARGTQLLVALSAPHEAYVAPNSDSAAIAMVRSRRPLTGEQSVLPVLGAVVVDRTRWLDVLLPGRPNGRSGWISADHTTASRTSWSIVIHTESRSMSIDQYGRTVQDLEVVVGTAATPTPTGRFFVEEVLALPPTEVGAPYAFALSARSNVFQEFAGGPGQVAIHGLENVGGVPGTAASHGCVRVDRATLAWMVTRIGPGVPVTVEL
jgi:hypothetical protein